MKLCTTLHGKKVRPLPGRLLFTTGVLGSDHRLSAHCPEMKAYAQLFQSSNTCSKDPRFPDVEVQFREEQQ